MDKGQWIFSPFESILPDLTKRDEPIFTGLAAVKAMFRPVTSRNKMFTLASSSARRGLRCERDAIHCNSKQLRGMDITQPHSRTKRNVYWTLNERAKCYCPVRAITLIEGHRILIRGKHHPLILRNDKASIYAPRGCQRRLYRHEAEFAINKMVISLPNLPHHLMPQTYW